MLPEDSQKGLQELVRLLLLVPGQVVYPPAPPRGRQDPLRDEGPAPLLPRQPPRWIIAPPLFRADQAPEVSASDRSPKASVPAALPKDLRKSRSVSQTRHRDRSSLPPPLPLPLPFLFLITLLLLLPLPLALP